MAIYAKLLEIQKKHLAFEKDTSNPFFKSKYVSLDSIVEKVSPLLDEQKLLALHYTQEKQVITEIIDTEDGTSVKSSFPLIESNDPQKLGSCISYAKRYNLGQIFNIITDRDDDGNTASGVEDKKEHKEEAPEKPWYNDTDKHLDEWTDLIAEGKTTQQAIIDNIESKFRLSKASKDKILKLF